MTAAGNEQRPYYTLLVTCRIKPEHRDAFIAALLDDARGSVANEPGCVRFDVIADEEDPNRIHLYEVYRDRAAFDAHLQTPHFLRWRATTQDWFAEPPPACRGFPLFRTEELR